MSAIAIGLPARRTLPAVAALATAAAAALALALALAGGSADADSRTVALPGGAQLDHPDGWRAAGAAEIARSAPGAAALLVRDDRRGLIVVRRRGPVRGSLPALARGLERDLRRRLPDVAPVGARIVRLATGPALSYTFVRRRSGTVHSVVAAPVAGGTVTLEAVAAGDATEVARELGAITRSLR